MAKSSGNYITIRDALEKWNPNLLRLYFLSTKYRRSMIFDEEKMMKLKSKLRAVEKLWDSCQRLSSTDEQGNLSPKIRALKQRFTAHMNEDFNTPAAIQALYEVAELINTSTAMQAEGILKNSYQTIAGILAVLGLFSVKHNWSI
jgi:Cysteinyl-tRNA synthetase